jgi:hypothetical protein
MGGSMRSRIRGEGPTGSWLQPSRETITALSIGHAQRIWSEIGMLAFLKNCIKSPSIPLSLSCRA